MLLKQAREGTDEILKEICFEGVKDLVFGIISEIQANLGDEISLSEQHLSSIRKVIFLKLKFNSHAFKDINSFKDFVLDLCLNASSDSSLKALLASAKPGQVFKVSLDGNSLVPFYPAGAFSFYAYLKPDSPFTTQKGQDWSIVPLNAVMYDSTNSFDISSHSFSVPCNGLWLFVAKVWCDASMTGKTISLGLTDNFTTSTISDMSYPRWESTYTFPQDVPSQTLWQKNRQRMATGVGVYRIPREGCKVALMICCADGAIINGDINLGQGRTCLFGGFLGE